METPQTWRMVKKKAAKWQPSILIYLIVMNFILLCLLFPTLALYFFRQEIAFQNSHFERMIAQMRQDIELRSSSLVHNLALSAGQALTGFNFSFLNILISDVVNENPEIVYTYIMDPGRRILVHNDPSMVGQTLEDTTSEMIADLKDKIFLAKLTADKRPTPVRFFDMETGNSDQAANVMEVVTPVYSGLSLAGFLRCGYSLEKLAKDKAVLRQEWNVKMRNLKLSFSTITVLFFLVGVGVSFLSTRTFIRSMRELSDGVERVSKGDLKHRIWLDGIVCREFTHLSESFNTMSAKLSSSYEQLEKYSRDLEQKVEERTKDLKMAQANLLRQAHEAGMAEMAVGILHNIGNAITPAKVSTALLVKKINESSIRNHIKEMMARFYKTIAEPESVPPEEKEQLKELAAVLPDAVMEDYEHINNEIKKIRDKHDHIESIIHLQLRYARLSGNIENVQVNKVVHDSLEMLEESIGKYSVTVTKRLDPDLPYIRIEQPKLLQVIINLIKNGVEAMKDTGPGRRILEISTQLEHSGEFIAIKIKDSGMGFSPEQEKRLFTYGYTTKKEGSGFGLHSCANFLIANKGSIDAKSKGPGKGAEFTVRLPLKQTGENNEVG